MADLNVYFYIQQLQAADSSEYATLRNLPMYQNTFKVFRKTSTTLSLVVRSLDRRNVKVHQDRRYYLNILSQDGQYSLLKRLWRPFDVEKGILTVEIEARDIENIPLGRYPYSITMIDHTGVESPLYLDQSAGATGELEILKNVLPVKLSPYIQFRFMKVRTKTNDEYPDFLHNKKSYISSRLPTSDEGNILEVYTDKFHGKVKVQATRDLDPNQELSWHDILETEYDWFDGALEDEVSEKIELPKSDYTFYRVFIEHILPNDGKVIEIRYF